MPLISRLKTISIWPSLATTCPSRTQIYFVPKLVDSFVGSTLVWFREHLAEALADLALALPARARAAPPEAQAAQELALPDSCSPPLAPVRRSRPTTPQFLPRSAPSIRPHPSQIFRSTGCPPCS